MCIVFDDVVLFYCDVFEVWEVKVEGNCVFSVFMCEVLFDVFDVMYVFVCELILMMFIISGKVFFEMVCMLVEIDVYLVVMVDMFCVYFVYFVYV